MLTAIVGVNWGDEGKGRMVDLLTSDEEVVLAQAMGTGNEAAATLAEAGDDLDPETRAELEKAVKAGEKAKQRLARVVVQEYHPRHSGGWG